MESAESEKAQKGTEPNKARILKRYVLEFSNVEQGLGLKGLFGPNIRPARTMDAEETRGHKDNAESQTPSRWPGGLLESPTATVNIPREFNKPASNWKRQAMTMFLSAFAAGLWVGDCLISVVGWLGRMMRPREEDGVLS